MAVVETLVVDRLLGRVDLFEVGLHCFSEGTHEVVGFLCQDVGADLLDEVNRPVVFVGEVIVGRELLERLLDWKIRQRLFGSASVQGGSEGRLLDSRIQLSLQEKPLETQVDFLLFQEL